MCKINDLMLLGQYESNTTSEKKCSGYIVQRVEYTLIFSYKGKIKLCRER